MYLQNCSWSNQSAPTNIRQTIEIAQTSPRKEMLVAQVVQVSPTTPLLELAERMLHKISYVFITEPVNERSAALIRVVTEQDLIQRQELPLELVQVQAQTIVQPIAAHMNSTVLEIAPQAVQRSQVQTLTILGRQPKLIKLVRVPNLVCSLNAVLTQPTSFCVLSLNNTAAAHKIEQLHIQNRELEEQIVKLQEQLQAEVAKRQQIEIAFQQANELLETRLKERSVAWEQVTTQLLIEIAERKRTEDILKRMNEQLQSVLDAVPGPVTWIDENLHYLGVNRQAAIAFNTSAESFIGQKVGFLDHNSEFNQFIHHLFASNKKTASQEIVSSVKGTSRNYLVVGQKYHQEQAAVFVGTDITHLKQIEMNLRHSLQLLSDFKYGLEQATILSIMDAQGMMIYVNDKFCTISQYSREELIGQMHLSLNSKYYPQAFLQTLWSTVTRGQVWRGEVQNQAKDGNYYWLDMTIIPFLKNAGKPYQYLVIQTDITDRKRAEAETQTTLQREKELSDLKSRFISMASHEFRTPLAVIASSAGILKDFSHKLSEEQKKKHLNCIQSYVEHATHLLDDILLINRVEAGKLAFKPELLNLEEFCCALIEEMQLNAPAVTILFCNQNRQDVTQSDTSYLTNLDKKLLRQILVNLLSNAIKFSGQGTSIQFHLTIQLDTATFVIADEGIGIPQADQSCIFQAFHRGSNVDTVSGNGLGLSIVKKCSDLHGGNVTFTSTVDVGSTFTVSLPLERKLIPETSCEL